MSEKNEGAGAGPERNGVGELAAALALSSANTDPGVAEDARIFLQKQARLAELQAQELAHELDLRHWSLLVRHVSGVLKLTLELGLGLLLLALVAGISVMVWNAAHSDGLVIESFSVPPDMAARGLTGEVVASKALDELTTLQTTSYSSRAAKSYANSWSGDIKAEIPDTGVSVGEAYRFLKSWVGRETRIGGDVVRVKDGIAISARISSGGNFTVTGPEDDPDTLIRKLAEKIYSQTQPYRYGVYLMRHFRNDEAIAVFRPLALSGPPEERAWGYSGWSSALTTDFNLRRSLMLRGLELQPDNLVLLGNIQAFYGVRGQWTKMLSYQQREEADLRGGAPLLDLVGVPAMRKSREMRRLGLQGAYSEAARALTEVQALERGGLNGSFAYGKAQYLAQAHDLAAARATMENPDPYLGAAYSQALNELAVRLTIAMMAQDWSEGLTQARRYPPLASKDISLSIPVLLARIQAGAGDIAAAERSISVTPSDCYYCLRARAQIAELQHQRARADFWFARAVAEGPSFPFAFQEWGQALLERGQPDAAIEKFTLSNEKGPHFADPLEGWGEALMAKNQSHLALAKFEEADKYAPNWGRLPLKWGEALVYAGKKDEAKAQFARAAQLDLTPSEKSELARHP